VRVTTDQDRCIASGQCVLAAAEVFDQDEDGIVRLIESHPPAEHQAGARRAVALCPARVIAIEE
jgi:ferredoxin